MRLGRHMLLLAAIIATGIAPSRAGTVLIEFSGTLSSVTSYPTGFEHPLRNLLGSTFSGTFTLPDSAFTREPDFVGQPFGDEDMTWYRHNFDAGESFFSVTFDEPGFDIHDGTPTWALVSTCPYPSCPFQDNFVWLVYEVDEHGYLLSFIATPDASVESRQIPGIDLLERLHPGFGVYHPEWASAQEDSISVGSSFEDPPTVNIQAIPLPPSFLLLGLPTLLLFVRRRGLSLQE